jgi:Ca-activated chloride channel family protein
MRPSLLAIAITASLLAACSTNETAKRDEPKDAAGQTVATTSTDSIRRTDDSEHQQFAQKQNEMAADGYRQDAGAALAKTESDLRDEPERERAEQKAVTRSLGAMQVSPAAPPVVEEIPAQPAMPSEAYAPAVNVAVAPMGVPKPATVIGGMGLAYSAPANTEHYAEHIDNPTQRVAENPVSTFSIDVDTGSYSNVRRMLADNQRPPADSVRAEEMINYFDYGYPAPTTRAVPFLVNTEIAPAPWNAKHELLQIGIQGYTVPKTQIPAANLVFLIDTSGSMDEPDKLPLLRESFKQLVAQLRPQDRISIVVYAGSAGLVLPPTSGAEKGTILAALDQLAAGGSTNGGEGLQLAYAVAKQGLIRNGVNRVILATDGDFNVGTFDQKALETMIADQRQSGIALTTLGFGTGNYNDSMAEQLADIGNGNHAYIDNLTEGRKVLVEEMSSTLLTIAQDVKIQVEFNPAVVAEYRLIGYENRALRREDFNNDKVDAGEIGAGSNVTALYELTLVGSGGESVDPLRYGGKVAATEAKANEIGLLRLRYKQPGATQSRLIENPLSRSQIHAQASERMRFAASVAAYADLLRGGKNVGHFGWNDVRRLAASAQSNDRLGTRDEFLHLVDRARAVTGSEAPVAVSE